jgi:hypothetical protein
MSPERLMAQIFRKAALDRLSSSEELDRLLQVTSPRGWIALTGLSLLLTAALLWGIFGRVSTTVEGQGILIRPDGVRSIESPRPGVVLNVLVRVGDLIYKDREVVRLSGADQDTSATQLVCSNHSGRVLEVLVREGRTVERGTPLLILEPVDRRLQALIYVPSGEGQRIQPGMRAGIAPAPVKWSEFGHIVGQVSEAAKFAASRQAMMQYLENEELVKSLTRSGPCVEVLADLTADPGTPSGYKWSSSRGPPLQMHHGTPCRVRIVVREQRPLSLVIPTVRDLLGF